MGEWGKFLRTVTVWSLEERAGSSIEDGHYVDNFLLFTLAFTIPSFYFKIHFWISETSLRWCVYARFPFPDLYCQLHSRYKMRSEGTNLPHWQASRGQDALSCFSVLQKMRTDKWKKTKETSQCFSTLLAELLVVLHPLPLASILILHFRSYLCASGIGAVSQWCQRKKTTS